MTDEYYIQFLNAAKTWVCGGYFIDIRFIAKQNGSDCSIWVASVVLNPLPPVQDNSFLIDSDKIIVGQIQKELFHKEELIDLLTQAMAGRINIVGKELKVPSDGDRPPYYYSETNRSDRWSYNLHLQVSGSQRPPLTSAQYAEIDNSLRMAALPFDGLADIATWLDLTNPAPTSSQPTINIRIMPPVDIAFDECSLANDLLLSHYMHIQYLIMRGLD